MRCSQKTFGLSRKRKFTMGGKFKFKLILRMIKLGVDFWSDWGKVDQVRLEYVRFVQNIFGSLRNLKFTMRGKLKFK